MSEKQSTAATRATIENKHITKQDMKELIYAWGMTHKRYPIFPTCEEEIEHFGKPVSAFSKNEICYYSKYMTWLECAFEIQPTARLGM